MKILRQLNRLTFILIISFSILLNYHNLKANDPQDIWEKNNNENNNKIKLNENLEEPDVKKIINNEILSDEKILQENNLSTTKVRIVGLYDPYDNGLTIDMWSNSDGAEILNLLKKIDKINLSQDAKNILNISLLTNSYFPKKNISEKEFLDIKKKWLIKNNNLELLEEYLVKNFEQLENLELLKYVLEEYLSRFEIKKSCEFINNFNRDFNDDYLTKFKIYCLVNDLKIDEAQLLLDIKKELGMKDNFFEEKIYSLIGLKSETASFNKKEITQNLLYFHLSHRTDKNFSFEPSEKTPKKIWRYLSSANLLKEFDGKDLEDLKKISLFEKAAHEGNYDEKNILELYKYFQFNINQLLNVEESAKTLKNIEARALIYQGILLAPDVENRLKLLELLKKSFEKDNIGNAFNNELSIFLTKIDEDDVPANYKNFYKSNLISASDNFKKIKLNNKVIHQSKLINYFRSDISKKKIEKEVDDILRKTSKRKDYFVSTKDKILLESLFFDGVKIDKKYRDIIKKDGSNMPDDIQDLINRRETGLVLLRLVEIIGQDNVKDIGSETLYFIISALNQLDIDPLRNKILLKVLPLKV